MRALRSIDNGTIIVLKLDISIKLNMVALKQSGHQAIAIICFYLIA